jgi:hypothetical protein
MTIRMSAVRLVAFPHEDSTFAAAVHRLAGAMDEFDEVAPEWLERRVRQVYPAAVVHAQDPLAGLRIDQSTWYVYRDGSPLGGLRDAANGTS